MDPETQPVGDAALETVTELVGVYHADGSLGGEVAYVVGKLLGRAHCALCDITHGALRQKGSWKACKEGLPVPFSVFHRDDQPDDVRAAGHVTPVVVARLAGGRVVRLLGPAELDACGGEPTALVAAVGDAVEREGLAWT